MEYENNEIIDDPIQVRLCARENLIASGKNPYGHAFKYSHHVSQIVESYDNIEDGQVTDMSVTLAGRIMAKRNQGKAMFLELRDSGVDIQLFARVNTLGEELFAELGAIDVGDWVGVSGKVMKTRRGQLSISLESFELLSKSIRPLPEKFHGLSDKETRYRQRYVDLIMNKEVREIFEKRFKIIKAVRNYMDNDGYFEVETPVLHGTLGGANARPFQTHHNALGSEFYLRIATELHLKRLLVGGFEKVYEIGRIFRNEGMDATHNPEFTTLESYQAFGGLEDMMDLTQGIIRAAATSACGTLQVQYQGQNINLAGDWPRRTMCELASEGAGKDISFNLSLEELIAIVEENAVKVDASWGKGKLIAEIFEATAESMLIQPTFVTEHPVEVSPLAKKLPGNEDLTERFELFICGNEYANAFNELNDPVDQARRFRSQLEAKTGGDAEAMEFDADFVRALEYGMPPAGGLGIGIDRLVMLLTDSATIRDVLLFPHMRPEANL